MAVALHEGTLLLGAVALVISVVWLRADQRIAALLAITLFTLWSAYCTVRELVESQLGYESSVWEVELVAVVLILLGCYAAQLGHARPAATSAEPR